jgi:hypothetical protein
MSLEPWTILPEQEAMFEFELSSRMATDKTVLIEPWVVDDPVNLDFIWNSYFSPQVLDDSGQLSNNLLLKKGEKRRFFIRVPLVPSFPDGTKFSLAVNASAESNGSSTGWLPFVIGQETISPDTTVELRAITSYPYTALDNQYVWLEKEGDWARIEFFATFSEPGTYWITANVSENTELQK